MYVYLITRQKKTKWNTRKCSRCERVSTATKSVEKKISEIFMENKERTLKIRTNKESKVNII